MKSDHDEAVSTVIALMLILAILSTCIAIYSATYVPGLKQQSEILHSGEVQYAFQRLSSDVDNLYSLDRPSRFSEPVPLGGGDILLSPVKSSGTIELQNRKLANITVGGDPFIVNSTTIRYTPSYSSWELQGYMYQNGVVWITKGEKKTPADLTLHTVQAGTDRENITASGWLNQMRPRLLSDGNYTMQIASMTPESDKNFVTGSGIAKVRLNATMETKSYESASVTFGSETLLSSANITVNVLHVEVSAE